MTVFLLTFHSELLQLGSAFQPSGTASVSSQNLFVKVVPGHGLKANSRKGP